MSGPVEFPAVPNPFSSRFTRPGALAYRFADDREAAELVDLFQDQGSRGQIVGPHGSGKSTLLASLAAAFAERGRTTAMFTLHDGQRRLPGDFFTLAGDDRLVVIVDGYEQLGRWHRWRLALRCRQRSWGLLVSCHEAAGLPILWRTAVDLDLALQLVRELLPTDDARIGDEDVRTAYRAHGGNLREVYFALYDVYEARRRAC